MKIKRESSFSFTQLLLIFVALCVTLSSASASTINFDGLPDLTPIRDTYINLGVFFTRATAITAGESLNEIEFPPHSGENTVFDNTGNIIVDFLYPVTDISGYFTYATQINLYAYDDTGTFLGSVGTKFFSNMLLNGDTGSNPNELLKFHSDYPIAILVIEGSSSGSSFVMDDFSFGTLNIPEPSIITLLVFGITGLTARVKKSTSQRGGV